MTVVQINATCTLGSTGAICCAISRMLDERGIENFILHTQDHCVHPRGVRYAGRAYLKVQALRSRIGGNYGLNSKHATRRLLDELDRIRPDIVHLHNLHGHNLHLKMLLDYLREKGIKTFWTFHDCWAFTAYCPYYTMAHCDRWQTGCHDCPQRRSFSWFWDRSPWMYARKREAARGLDLTVITPSEWMATQVRQSFFGHYPLYVIHNGIDLATFKPTVSDFRQKHGLEGKKILLGVAYRWSLYKGLDVLIRLASRLNDSYRVVLVGTDRRVERQLPEGILAIRRTADPAELAAIYSAADVFVNPTREEVLGLVNIEALACGVPVVTFDTGGSPECVDRTCGMVIPRDDIDGLLHAVCRVAEERPFTSEACVAYASRFDAENAFGEYLKLYGL